MDHQRIGTATQTDRQRQTSPAVNPSLPTHPSVNPILQLHQAIGNQAMSRLLQSRALRAKLKINQPGDIYEEEADRVAEQVMRMPAPALQRTCAPCAAGVTTCPACEDETEKLVLRKTEVSSDRSDTVVPDDILSGLGPGEPLDSVTRAFFEPRLGYDFSRVRVHTDARAADSARAVNARAYTVGDDVVFAAGSYSPSTPDGRQLLAHELTHTIQQIRDPGISPETLQRQVSQADAEECNKDPKKPFTFRCNGIINNKPAKAVPRVYYAFPGKQSLGPLQEGSKVTVGQSYGLWLAVCAKRPDKHIPPQIMWVLAGYIDQEAEKPVEKEAAPPVEIVGPQTQKSLEPVRSKVEKTEKPIAQQEKQTTYKSQIDIYAGAFIGIRGIVEALKGEVATTRARALVFSEGSRTVDWNNALDYLKGALTNVDGWLTSALELTYQTYAEDKEQAQAIVLGSLESELIRIGQALRIIGIYLASIRAAQYALHDAPSFVTGEFGFNQGIIDRAGELYKLLERLQSRKDSAAEMAAEINEAVSKAENYIKRFYEGLETGVELLKAAQVIGLITSVIGIGTALAGIARLLAGAAAGGGALALAGGGTLGVASAASIEAILQGVKVAAGGTVMMMAGGKVPTDVGKAGEAGAGVTGPKEPIPSLTKTAEYRVPDKLTEVTLEEVKNVLKLSNTRQLRDFLLYSQQTGRTFILWVRQTTKLSGPLQDLVNQGLIQLKYLP